MKKLGAKKVVKLEGILKGHDIDLSALKEFKVTEVNYFSRSATIIIPGSPLPSKPAPYPKRVKREPAGRPEIHPPATVAPPVFGFQEEPE